MVTIWSITLFIVFKVSPSVSGEDLEYVGCYSLAVLGKRVSERGLKLDSCASFCRNSSRAFAAYRNTQICYCLTNMTGLVQEDGGCPYHCHNDPPESTRTCGGSKTASMYIADRNLTGFALNEVTACPWCLDSLSASLPLAAAVISGVVAAAVVVVMVVACYKTHPLMILNQ